MSAVEQTSPLKWETNSSGRFADWYTATTPFGNYGVEKKSHGGWEWGYCFDEYYDEKEFPCDSAEEGKRLAQANWDERVEPIITAYVAARSRAAL